LALLLFQRNSKAGTSHSDPLLLKLRCFNKDWECAGRDRQLYADGIYVLADMNGLRAGWSRFRLPERRQGFHYRMRLQQALVFHFGLHELCLPIIGWLYRWE
jgi:hypothetical protein